jgi:mannitol-specific phosphotransferase system IIBC component
VCAHLSHLCHLHKVTEVRYFCYTLLMTAARTWLALALLLGGMTVSYTYVVAQRGDIALANGGRCPAMQECQGAGCNAHTCKNGECGHTCPGCKAAQRPA